MPSTPIPAAPPLTFHDLLAALWRRRVVAATAAAIVLVLVVVAAQAITPLYRAQAALMVERGRQAIAFVADPEFGSIDIGLLNTQKELLLSSPVLERAATAPALAANPAYAEAPTAVLSERLLVSTDRDSWVIKLTLLDETPDGAREGLGAVVDAFLAVQAERKADRTRDAAEFLRGQVAEAEAGLARARAAERGFRTERGIQSIDPDANHHALRVNALVSQRVDMQRVAAAASAQLAQIAQAQQVADPAARRSALLRVPAVAQSALVIEQQQQLYALAAQRAQLAETYLAKHPRMIDAERQVAAKEAQLDEAQAIAVAAARTLASTIADELAALDRRIADGQAELATYRGDLLTLATMNEDILSRARLHEQLLMRLREEEIASRNQAQPVAVMNPPNASRAPANVRGPIVAAVALLASLGAAMAAALLGETLDRRLRGAAQAGELAGLPVLGTVPRAASLPPLGRGGDPSLPPMVAEAFRGLRTALRLATSGDGCRCIAVLSPAHGDGRSTVATRLATSLAATGARVLLVDADLRRPSLHHQLGEAGERGLSFLLAGYTGIDPHPTSWANLEFLGVGVRPPNPGELLHSPGLQWLIERARSQYEWVIIDTPPLLVAADALVVAEQADAAVLVARDRHTLKHALRSAVDRAGPVRAKLAGLIVNATADEPVEARPAVAVAS